MKLYCIILFTFINIYIYIHLIRFNMHTFNYIHSYIFSCVNMIWTYLNPGHLRWYLPSQNWSLGQTAGASCSCKFITRQVPHGFAFSRYLYSRLCKITSHGHRTDQDSLETSWSMLVTQLRIWATSLSMPTTAPWLRFFFLILLLCWSQSMFNRGCFDKRAPIKKWLLHSCYSRFCKNLAAVVTDRSDGCTNRAKASSSQTVTCWNFLPKLMPRSFRELSFWFAARTHSGPSKWVFSRTILSNFTCQAADYICIVLSWLGHKCQLFCYELKYCLNAITWPHADHAGLETKVAPWLQHMMWQLAIA